MNKLAKQLIKLGHEKPDLRIHIRPILNKIAARYPTNEELAEELNAVLEYAGIDNLAVEIENARDAENAVVVVRDWYDSKMEFGPVRNRSLVNRWQMMGNAKNMPDHVTPRQFNNAVAVSHPDVMDRLW